MRILIFGDIIGRGGRAALAAFLQTFLARRAADLVIANGENLAHGKGITPKTAEEVFAAGVQLLTNGNHVWDGKNALDVFGKDPRMIRPANFPPGNPGKGSATLTVGTTTVAVLNLVGRVFFREDYDDPFRAAEAWLAALPRVRPLVTLVDIHAEATSEKRALGTFLDGKVTAAWGTHTHIPTADEQILPRGTAYVTDVGMTGALHSILGFQPGPVIERFKTQRTIPFDVVEDPPWEVNALLLETDDATGRATRVARIREIVRGT